MRATIVSLCSALALCLAAVNANAGIIAQTGFNSDAYTNGTEITDPSQGAGEAGWTSGWVRPSSTGTANASNAIFNEGDMSLYLMGTQTPSNHARIARDFTPTTDRFLTQSVDAKLIAANGDAVSFYIRGDGGSQQATAVSVISDGSISIKNGDNAGGSSNLTIFPSGTVSIGPSSDWHNFSITTDLDTQKFTVSVDGVQSAVSGGEYFFRTTSPADPIEAMDRIEFWSSRDFEGHYDNLVVSAVPEPSTLAMLGLLGVAGVAVYRRK